MSDARSWTVLELLRWTQAFFASRGIESPRLDAECLLAHALGCDRLRLYLEYDKPVAAGERAAFRELVRARADRRVPVSHLTGAREFWSLPLRVTPDVLAPRPETETLVEAALELAPDPEAELRVLDVGTGGGAVALAVARERVKAQVTATDVSREALEVARANAEACGLAERVRLLHGDLYQPVAGERFDLVLANPPYLGESEAASLPPELAHEPRVALFAGADGLGVLRRLCAGLPGVLEPGGAVALEIAPDQADTVSMWLRDAGCTGVGARRDLARRPRVVAGRLPEGGQS